MQRCYARGPEVGPNASEASGHRNVAKTLRGWECLKQKALDFITKVSLKVDVQPGAHRIPMSVTDSLPLFPLGVVLYPNETMPLHIFEPRYRDLVSFCLDYDHPFGVIKFDEGEMADIGCTARVDKVTARYEDGKMDIVVRGERRFKLVEVRQERTYLTASVELLEDVKQSPASDLKERAITQHMKLLELAGRTVRPSLYQGVRDVSYVMAHNAGLTLDQKQKVLEISGENDRIAFLVNHFEELIPRVEQMEDVRRKIQSNGHFKDFPPEEKSDDSTRDRDE